MRKMLLFVGAAVLAVVAVGCTGGAQDQWGTLTGRMSASFPLGGGQVTVNAVEVELEDGSTVDATIQPGLTDSIGEGWRVRIEPLEDSEYEWVVVEIDRTGGE